MTVTRPVQQTLLEGVGVERPVGAIPASVFRGTNAQLIAAVADLYLTGSVLDVTYGEGKWWDNFTPLRFRAHDLHKIDGVDFTNLPEDDDSEDAVCFDPPYVHSGGAATAGTQDFRDRFGLTIELGGVLPLILGGMTEACRVARHFVLVKCMEFAQGSTFHDIPFEVTLHARSLGWAKHDTIVHHTGSGPGGQNIFEIKRARRHHSYLLVFVPEGEQC